MITHHGIWAIAHTSSRSVGKHSYIPGAYPRKHLLIPCPTNAIVGHILAIVSNKHIPAPLTKARIGLERQRQTRAVWAKRTECSIEQIRQSLQRLKIVKIVRMQNLHNFRTIDSVFSDTCLRYKLSIIDTRLSQTHTVGHSSRCMLTRSRSQHMSNYSYVVSATYRHRLFPLCYES